MIPMKQRHSAPMTVLVAIVMVASTLASAATLAIRPAVLHEGDSWTSVVTDDPATLPALESAFEARTYWDLRPLAIHGRLVRHTVETPQEAGLVARARALGADLALCVRGMESGARLSCSLMRADGGTAAGLRALETDAAETGRLGAVRPRSVRSSLDPSRSLTAGDLYREVVEEAGRTVATIDGRAVAEGIVLLPAGPREAVLVRETTTASGASRLRYRFLTAEGREVATLEVAPEGAGRLTHVSLLSADGTLANNGIKIPYTSFHRALTPGLLGFLQFGVQTSTPLTSVNPAWTGVNPMIAINATNVPYQPDPSDPSSATTLPEVWNFTGLTTSNLTYRLFNTVRSDLVGNICAQACASRDLSAAPPDGTWQSYLKIDVFAPGGAFSTRNIFDINDNDTGANPSIDVPYVAQDENNVQGRTQICFQQSVGGAARLLKFFQFTGASPAAAMMGVGDTWTSGAWTECDDTHGLRLTAASVCGSSCWPGCTTADPRGRGRLGAGVGFRSTVIEDGWVKVPTGNYLPSLLMRQDTDIQAGLDFLSLCQLGTTNNRAFDYFWLNASYGFVASVSSVANETMPANDWTASGNVTDGAIFTWGPYPPYQTEARACLAGTKVSWSLPADGSNLGTSPGVTAYGYVVSWGSSTDPEQLADWAANPNHTPLPGVVGYLAAPVGSEPTSTIITGWPGASINATVVTALKYTDPDVADLTTYRSAALYKVTENPAKLSAATFRVGQSVAPFVQKSGSNLVLAWPAVAGAASYHLRVFNLDTKSEIACPVGLNCNPVSNTATHTGAGTGSARYGYLVTATDPCGAASAD
jgi:hypothetical protein